MPRYFLNSNNSDPEDVARNEVEIRSMVEYLFAKVGALEYQPVTISGNASNGQNACSRDWMRRLSFDGKMKNQHTPIRAAVLVRHL